MNCLTKHFLPLLDWISLAAQVTLIVFLSSPALLQGEWTARRQGERHDSGVHLLQVWQLFCFN